MLPKKAKYGLKALLLLAQERGRGPRLISDLAEREQIPANFWRSCSTSIAQASWRAARVEGGGYLLAKPPDRISFGEAMRVLDGTIAQVPCVSRTAHRPCEECIDEATCGVRMVMKEVRDEAAAILDRTTLADVVERIETASSGKRGLLMYHI